MKAHIIDGKKFANKWQQQIAKAINHRLKQGQVVPGLAVVLVGNHFASTLYVRNKQQACKEVGIAFKLLHLPQNTSQQQMIIVIKKLNDNNRIDGILVQLPLPNHINTTAVLTTIDAKKDVDGLHPLTLHKLARSQALFHPCTAYGVIQLLKTIVSDFSHKQAVVIGDSAIAGKPIAIELQLAGSQVSVGNKYTKNIDLMVRAADILVVAIGQAQFILAKWIKPKAIVIDVGINHLPNGKIVGDVEFTKACDKASYITPVPGGIGPITIAALLQNTLNAVRQNKGGV